MNASVIPALATSGRSLAALGFLLFLGTLAAVDWSLSRWGSAAIRRRPRPGARVTALFLGVVAACGLLEAAAVALSTQVPVISVVLVLLQPPVAATVALALDRAIRA